NIFASVRALVIEAVEELGLPDDANEAALYSRITAEPPRDTSHGDVATNAAMVLAKPSGENPRVLAERLAEKLRGADRFAAVEVAGPGFINMRMSNAFLHQHLDRKSVV